MPSAIDRVIDALEARDCRPRVRPWRSAYPQRRSCRPEGHGRRAEEEGGWPWRCLVHAVEDDVENEATLPWLGAKIAAPGLGVEASASAGTAIAWATATPTLHGRYGAK